MGHLCFPQVQISQTHFRSISSEWGLCMRLILLQKRPAPLQFRSFLPMNMQPEKYKLLRKLGLGTHATVYEACQLDSGKSFALKVEPKRDNSTLVEEAKLLKFLNSERREEGIPEVYRCSYQGDKIVMVLELLGPSVEDLFLQHDRKFGLSRALFVCEQALRRLEFLHRKGYLHRDVKPQNLLIGKEDTSSIYLVDFGLAVRYIQNDGTHIAEMDKLPFVGNPRFASLRAHQGKQLSRADDIESLVFVLVYLIKGSLPWQGIKGVSVQEKLEKIKEKKEANGPELLCKGLPSQIQLILCHCRALAFEQAPNYGSIRAWLKAAMSQSTEEAKFSQWVKESAA